MKYLSSFKEKGLKLFLTSSASQLCNSSSPPHPPPPQTTILFRYCQELLSLDQAFLLTESFLQLPATKEYTMSSIALKYLTFTWQIELQSIASRDRCFIFEEIREQTGSSSLAHHPHFKRRWSS